MRGPSLPVFVSVACLVLASCASRPERSGFLGDVGTYSMLQPSETDSNTWIWRNPSHGLGEFDRVMIDFVEVVPTKDSSITNENAAEVRRLANHFYSELVRVLTPAYPPATRPEPGVLRIYAAITDVDASEPLLNVLPQGTITGVGVGGATMEAMLRDAATGRRIAMIMAKGKGRGLRVDKGLSKWGHTGDVLTHWAELLRQRLDEAHGVE